MTIVPSKPAIAIVGALLWAAGAVPAVATPPETPEAFVRRVYALYRNDGPGVDRDRPGGTPFYAAVMLDAYARDGNAATIDWDPVCDCQAYENLAIKRVTISGGPADTVKARVSFTNLREMRTVTLTLSRTPDGWRIADVGDKGAASVMALLAQADAPPGHDVPPGGADTSRPKP